MYGVAMVAAIARTVVRLRIQRRLLLDDILLLVACVFLTTAVTLLYVVEPLLYWNMRYFLNPGKIPTPPDLIDKLTDYQRYIYSQLTLAWTTIFAVKFSFLFFFRNMVDRMRMLVILWRVVIVTTSISFVLCISSTFIACPYIGPASSKFDFKSSRPGKVTPR